LTLPTVLSERRVELWVEARNGVPAVNPIMRSLLDELAAAGAAVSVRVPEHEIHDPLELASGRPPDLVLLKSATTLALSLAVADEAHGVKFLNGARATLRAHDKAATIARLAAAGLPVPETYVLERDADSTVEPQKICGEWVAKPTRGIHGRGVVVHPNLAAALGAPAAILDPKESYIMHNSIRLIQRRIGGKEPDVKVYVAGKRCFAGRKAFGPVSYRTDRIEPLDLDAATREKVLAVGEALGLRCFGVDLRFLSDRPVIIDANPFPGYRGFPTAVPVLQSEIERALLLKPANR
jgi:ribosomal protein S6--L-glutamate ligase